MLKKILIATTIFEGMTGLLLMATPLSASSMLLGAESLDAVAITIVRITGAAILSIAMICWVCRQKDSALNVVKVMLFYNIAVASVLIYTKLNLDLKGVGLLSATAIHLFLAAWSVFAIVRKSD